MSGQNEWQRFFDSHSPKYDENVFTRDTEREVRFLLELLALPRGAKVLDMGCGTGRHAIGLAAAGLELTGVDISAGMLDKARQKAEQAGVEVNWIQYDARKWQGSGDFDAVLGLCEGAIGLLEHSDDPWDRDVIVLQNMAASLRPGGIIVITALNAGRPLRQLSDDDIIAGKYDYVAQFEPTDVTIETPEGSHQVEARERHYTPAELVRIVRQADLDVEQVWGGTAGEWARRPVRLDEYEIMVVARKKE
jgi:2-polyprenyl-3-methyl-5-hydroxy-6-metoxy-1,4-benzoquinol methylase